MGRAAAAGGVSSAVIGKLTKTCTRRGLFIGGANYGP